MSLIERYLEGLSEERELGREIVHRHRIPARPARWADFPAALGPELREGLAGLGIEKLYSHQAEAVERAAAGEDLVVVTPTASGKTLCYNLPVIQQCLREPSSRALYLFPMKALEQDQLGALRELAASCGARDVVDAEIYDGDTSAHRRAKIRACPPRVLVTNPDMLHLGILAHHQKWERFFEGLDCVVLDEVHLYRGVFGSHVAGLLRRLLRVAERYGSRPRIIASSATIANPGELVSRLAGRPVGVVEGSGAPEAARHFLFVNPRRLSPSTVAARLLRRAVREGLATIAFTKSRKVTELIYTWTVQSEPSLRRSVSAYRAGYLPEERRQIEQALFSGALKAVISTSALEVGIDIGVLDVCILVGYPGTVTTTWQRGGRVGRQDRDSLIIVVAGEDALDQYIMKNPRSFFEAGFEPAVIDPENRPIMKAHLTCAAAEIPLRRGEEWVDSEAAAAAIGELEREGGLVRVVGEDLWESVRRVPHRDVNLRGIGESFTIFEASGERAEEAGRTAGTRRGGEGGRRPRVVGSLDGGRVYTEGHPGAVYLHRARQYEVTRLDLERHNLWARPVQVGYFTQARREKETEIIAVRKSRPVRNFVARFGELKVTETVTGFEKKRIASQERLSSHTLDLPPVTFETVGFWIEIDPFVPRILERLGLNFMGGIHAVEHAAIALFPLFALCEREDVGGISIPMHPQVRKGAIFFYDGYPGGVGLCEKSFARLGELLEHTWRLISECDCEKGCPSCIYSSRCGSGNVPLDKKAAETILALLLDLAEGRELMAAGAKPAEAEAPLPEPEEETPPPAVSTGPRYLVLDIETLRGADDVGGWANSHLMGLALAVVWESGTGKFRTFLEDQAGDLLREMRKADLVVGFNLVGFDYRVLSAYDDGSLEEVATFDILADLRRRLGFRLSLAHLAESTLDEAKSADGLQSLAWVREGRMDLVEEYCRRDVEITARLFSHGLEKGWVRYLNREGRLMELVVDWDLDEIVRHARAGAEQGRQRP